MTAVLFTCAGQRVDIVTAFKRAGATTIAVDANPLAPALYHADRARARPARRRPGLHATRCATSSSRTAYGWSCRSPTSTRSCSPSAATSSARPCCCPASDVVAPDRRQVRRAPVLRGEGIPSPPSWLPDELPDDVPYPVLVKARARLRLAPHLPRATIARQLDFYLRYTPSAESFVQAVCTGEEFSIDVFCDFEGRCLNAIPRTMIESKGGESIKGMSIRDWDLIEFGRLRRRDAADLGPGEHPVLPRAGRPPRGHRRQPALRRRVSRCRSPPGGRYPELALALAEGERPEPRLGEFREGVVMTRFFSQVCLTAGEAGTLEPFAEEVPEPIASEPGEA